jgi:hypothetical protein
LDGLKTRPGIIRPPSIVVGRGALLVPGSQQQAVRNALDAVGASYDVIPVWRET